VNKKTPSLKLLTLLTLIFIVVLGLLYNNVNKPLTTNDACTISEKMCIISQENVTIRIEFDQRPIVEEELFVNFELNDDWTIEKTWIEGLNMFMGKTPIMFEDANNNKRGVTFLGSCNLAEMQWIMYIQIKQKDTDNTQLLTASFSTYN